MPDYRQTSAVFTSIYENAVWGGGSGASSPELMQPYIQLLTDFMRNNRVGSVVDVGCGDWQFSQTIDWSGKHYFGFDVVDSVIVANTRKFSNETLTFHVLRDMTDLPDADLVVCKDVLQHLPIMDINHYLDWFLAHYKWAIVTNDVSYTHVDCNGQELSGDKHTNVDIELGACRPLRLDLPPFNRRVASLLQWTVASSPYRWIKNACLLMGPSR